MKKKLLKLILKRLDEIEQRLGVFDAPKYDMPSMPSYLESKCSKCGILFEGVTSYYCSQPNCPKFVQPYCETIGDKLYED